MVPIPRLSLSRFYSCWPSPSPSRFYPYFPRPRPGFTPIVPVPVPVLPHPKKFQSYSAMKSLPSANSKSIDLYSDNKLQAFNKTIITYGCSPLPRCNLHHRIFHEPANPLLGKFCLPGLSYVYGGPAKENELEKKRSVVNRSSNARQTNADIFCLLESRVSHRCSATRHFRTLVRRNYATYSLAFCIAITLDTHHLAHQVS